MNYLVTSSSGISSSEMNEIAEFRLVNNHWKSRARKLKNRKWRELNSKILSGKL